MRADEGEVAHSHAPPVTLIYQRSGGQEIRTEVTIPLGRFEVMGVDCVDYLEMPWQHAFEQRHWPAFQCLRQQCVIGVRECSDGDLPGLGPRNIVKIDKNPHQLGDRDARMRVVELNGCPFRERVDASECTGVPMDKVLQRGRNEEVFLPQTQFSPRLRIIARIKNL